MSKPLSYRHRTISDEELIFIRNFIAAHPASSRRDLSKRLCEAWNWVQPNGALRDMVRRSMMLMLHRAGLIELPPVRQAPRQSSGARAKPSPVQADESPLQVSLAQLGELTARQVRRTSEEALFNSLMQQHHYLGYTQPVGEHLKYLVFAQGNPVACLANINLLAYNTRFLILPWVKVPHLASHILGRMGREICTDWNALYGHPIVFLETFIDPQRFKGTCYRAANWLVLGETTGRGKNDQTHKANRPIKQVLGYALVKDFRARLSATHTALAA